MEKYLKQLDKLKIENGTEDELNEFLGASTEYLISLIRKERCEYVNIFMNCVTNNKNKEIAFYLLGKICDKQDINDLNIKKYTNDDNIDIKYLLPLVTVDITLATSSQLGAINELINDYDFISEDLINFIQIYPETATDFLANNSSQCLFKQAKIILKTDINFKVEMFIDHLQNNDKLICSIAHCVVSKYKSKNKSFVIKNTKIRNLNHFLIYSRAFLYVKLDCSDYNQLKTQINEIDATYNMTMDEFKALKMYEINNMSNLPSKNIVYTTNFDFYLYENCCTQICDCIE